jgi:hypothetical protein
MCVLNRILKYKISLILHADRVQRDKLPKLLKIANHVGLETEDSY